MSAALFKKAKQKALYLAILALFSSGANGAFLDANDWANVCFQDAAGTTPVTAMGQPIGLIKDKSGRGNDAKQTVSANRPVISARYNLLTKTEQFDDASWGKNGLTVTANTTIAPNGTLSADTIDDGGGGATYHYLYRAETITGAFSLRCSAKDIDRQYLSLVVYASLENYVSATFDLVNKTVNTAALGAGYSVTSAVITPNANGFYDCVLKGVTAAASILSIGPSNKATAGYVPSYAGSSKKLILWGADFRPADQATGLIPTYQRVDTSTDYDTVGFPVREAYNGSNQLLGGASGGGATTGFFFCAGVMITKVGAAQTLFSDTGTNTGWRVRINASNQLELSAGNGTAYTTVATVGTVSINKLTVVTAWHDGTNLNVQINQGAVAQAAFAVATAGTAGYTLGCDNGASTNYLQGSLGEIVYRTGAAMNAAQIATTQAFVNSKQKAY